MPKTKAKSKKEILTNLVVLLATIIICLIILELILRIAVDKPDACRLYEKKENIIYGNKAGLNITSLDKEYEVVYSINNEGIRDNKNFASNKEENELRILTLGDSFTFGMGLNKEDTFQDVLENKLKNSLDKKVEVINGGVNGYGAKQSLELLKMKINEYNPDIVIYNFYINDLSDDASYLNFVIEKGCRIKKTMPATKKFLFLNSRTYLVYSSIKDYFMLRCGFSQSILFKLRATMSKAGLLQSAKFEYPYSEKEESNETRSRWKVALNDIEEMDSICKSNNCTFILEYVPAKEQVNDGYRREYLKKNGLNETDFDFESPVRILKEFSDKEDIQFIDLWEDIINKKINVNNPELYYEFDVHFNKNGAGVWGSILSEKILNIMNAQGI